MAWLNAFALLVTGVVFGAGSIAEGRHRRQGFFVLMGLAELAALAWVVFEAGPDVGRWRLGHGQLGAVPAGLLLGILCWADVVGLPRGFALRLGVGLREPRAHFDSLIQKTRERFFGALDRCAKDPRRTGHYLATAGALVDRLAGYDAPDSGWDECRNDTVACHRRVIAVFTALAAGLPGEDMGPGSDIEAAYLGTVARRRELYEAFEVDLGISGVEYVNRSHLSFAVTGVSAGVLVTGNSILASRISIPVATDPWLWFISCLAGIAVWLVLYAGALSIRMFTRRSA
jgi:hypothetical protein